MTPMGESDDVRLARMGLALVEALEKLARPIWDHPEVHALLDEARRLALSIDNGRLRREQEGDDGG